MISHASLCKVVCHQMPLMTLRPVPPCVGTSIPKLIPLYVDSNNFHLGCDAMRTNTIMGMGFQIELPSSFVTIDQCSRNEIE